MLVLLEEALSSLDELILANTPLVLEGVEDISFVVEDLNGALLGDVLKSYNTIGDSATLKDSNPTYLRSIICVGSTAGFSVNSIDVDYSEGVARDHTTLVESVSVLLLGFSLVHETLGDLVAFINKSVGLVLDIHLLLLGKTLEMGNIKMSLISCLFGSSLPDVRSKDFTARSEYQVGAGMVGLELSSAGHADLSLHSQAFNALLRELLIQDM